MPVAVMTILVSLTLVSRGQGQKTEVDRGSCTYSFVVPQPDLISTCRSYSSQQIDNLQKKINELQKKVDVLSTAKTNITLPQMVNPIYSCQCSNDTTFKFAYTDCEDVRLIANGVSGVYQVDPVKSTGELIEISSGNKNISRQKYWVAEGWGIIDVLCDVNEDVGWTVIMRRSKFDVSFDRDWYDYKWGFGKKENNGDFWLGLEYIYRITNQVHRKYSMWMIVEDEKQVPHIMPYEKFQLEPEDSDYMLTIDGYHGKVNSRQNTNRPFVTRDRIQMTTPSTAMGSKQENCAAAGQDEQVTGGGWWFSGYVGSSWSVSYRCGYINLNARVPYLSGFNNITSVIIKIKPNFI